MSSEESTDTGTIQQKPFVQPVTIKNSDHVNDDEHSNESTDPIDPESDQKTSNYCETLFDLKTTSPDEDDDDNSSKIIRSRFSMIVSYGRELLCLILLVLTTYATYTNSPPKISRAPAPQPFFPGGSYVFDWPAGNLGPTQNRVSSAELSFVLYYAPWCAESISSREPYENAAQLFHSFAHFAAINCWQPGGECRTQYSKVQSWPVLMAYQPNGIAVQYRGSWTSGAVSRFVKSMLSPLKRLTSPDDLLEYMTGKDGVVVSFVDLDEQKTQYMKFYQTAIKWLEKDPFQEVGMAVVTGETAKLFGVETMPSIRFYLWNETLEYYGNGTWKQEELTKWVSENVHQVSLWLSPTGTKSTALAPYMKQGPVLLFFTPRNFYTETSDAYEMLRQVGMEYYNCQGDAWVTEMARDYLVQQRNDNFKQLKRLRQKCDHLYLRPVRTAEKKCRAHKSVSVTFASVLNGSKHVNDGKNIDLMNYCEIGTKGTPEMYGYMCDGGGSDTEKLTSMAQKLTENNGQHCSVAKGPKKKLLYEENIFDEDGTADKTSFKTSVLITDFDERAPENIKKLNLKKKCEMLRLADANGPLMFYGSDEEMNLQPVSALACKQNRTLSLMAIDSIQYHVFAERLGIDILSRPNKTVVFILDHENESTYLLDQQPITLNGLVNFVHAYTRGTLPRYLRTTSTDYKHTHYFNLVEFRRHHDKVYESRTQPVPDHIFIQELNSKNFDEAVLRSNKTVVVLFHSVQCAFCSLLTNNLLSVARVLEDLGGVIEFYRIDGDKNDLQWEYTMEIFPSLIIFPASRKSESRIYPASLQVTVPNILGFVLANFDRPTRLYGIILACSYSQKISSQQDCTDLLQHEIGDNISFSLREWRNVPTRRRHILRRLRLLKTLYLHLLQQQNHHSCDFKLLEGDVKNIFKMWSSMGTSHQR